VGNKNPFQKTFDFVDTSTTHPTKGLPLKSFPTPQTHQTHSAEKEMQVLKLKIKWWVKHIHKNRQK